MWLILCGLLSFSLAHKLEVPPYVCDSLIEPPSISFDTPLEDVVVPPGSPLTLTCAIFGVPQGSITWYHRGKKVQEHPMASLELALNRKILGTGVQESQYYIPCVDVKSAGDYVCVAQSPCGETIASEATVRLAKGNRAEICPKKMLPVPYLSLYTVQRIELIGNPVQLQCRVAGVAKANVRWEKLLDDDTTTPLTGLNQYIPLSNGDLLIIGDDHDTSESFRCIAATSFGTVTADVSVVFVDEM